MPLKCTIDGEADADKSLGENSGESGGKSQTEMSAGWAEYGIVLDVSEAATNIAFGVMLGGEGRVWIDDLSFEEVGADVPTTDCPCLGVNQKGPKNLDFEE